MSPAHSPAQGKRPPRRILFVAQGAGLAELLAQTGGLLTEQLLNADVVVLRGVQNRAALSGLRAAIHSANPGAQVVRNRRSEIVRALEKPQLPPTVVVMPCKSESMPVRLQPSI